jgi:hypothetical protein
MDGAAAVKLVSGEAGYVLEDVPHVSDYLPDLPVSAAVPCGGGRSGGLARGAANRSLLLEGEVARCVASWRCGRIVREAENVESDDDPCDLKLSATFVILNNAFCSLL